MIFSIVGTGGRHDAFRRVPLISSGKALV